MLSKPSIAIPIAAVIAAIAGFIIVPMVGNPPAPSSVPALDVATTSQSVASSGSTQLAFQASGKVSAVNVAVGDHVTKGQVLASLDTSVLSGALAQAKANLSLAQAQLGSLNLQYANAQTQQNTLVANALHTLLSSGLQATPVGNIDETANPIITGTYSCSAQGSYEIDVYSSGTASGYSFSLKGLETGQGEVTYGTPQALGTCGLYITFVKGFAGGATWQVQIPNTQSATYQANLNAYNLAVSTRDQTLSQLSANIGQNGQTTDANVASATISVAQGAYQSALAQYDNALITAPADGTVTFIDADLKVGQTVASGRNVITILTQ